MREDERRRRRFWFLRRRPETVRTEIDEELNVHLQMRRDELTSRGLSPDAARHEASLPLISTRVAPPESPRIMTGSVITGSMNLGLIVGVPAPSLNRIVSTTGEGSPFTHPPTARLVLAAVIASRKLQGSG